MKDSKGHGSNARGSMGKLDIGAMTPAMQRMIGAHRDMNGRPLQEGNVVMHPGYPTYGNAVVTRTFNEAGSGRPLVTIKTTSGISATHDPQSLIRKGSNKS